MPPAAGADKPVTPRREHWSSRLGFVLAASGSAVGLGNIWKFPHVAGEHGGVFLPVYLGIVFTLGLGILLAELAIGRAAQRNPVGAFRVLGGRLWPLVGYLGILAGFLILSFYTVVAGWTLAFAFKMGLGAFDDPAVAPAAIFQRFVGDPVQPVISAAAFMALTVAVVVSGVRGGIERGNRVLMPLLFLILATLAVRALTLPNAAGGLLRFLRFDPVQLTPELVTAALGQAFFSLSIGMGAMVAYGSYLRRGGGAVGAAAAVVGLDTLAAFLAAAAILPAVFAFGLEPSSGPGLAFVSLPAVFAHMPAGALFGTMFFILLSIAALTSAISLLEPIVAYFTEHHGFRRSEVTLAAGLYAFLLGVPSSLSMAPADGPAIFGRPFLDLLDRVATDTLLPLGGLLIALFVGWVMGPRAIHEVFPDTPSARWIGRLWLTLLRLPVPAAVVWILVAAYLD
jgi:NSS family neurotransmitter:Na+ symporter